MLTTIIDRSKKSWRFSMIFYYSQACRLQCSWSEIVNFYCCVLHYLISCIFLNRYLWFAIFLHVFIMILGSPLAFLSRVIMTVYMSFVQIILVTHPRTGDLREALRYIYNLYVEYVVKNPLYTPGAPIR